MFYAIKETVSYGNPLVLVATGSTHKECEENAKQALQEAHGGLWAGEYRNCFIGRVSWLKKQFPKRYVEDLIANA